MPAINDGLNYRPDDRTWPAQGQSANQHDKRLAAAPGDSRTIEELPLDALAVPREYQRRQNPRLVRQIVRSFDPLMVGLLTVCRDQNGGLWLIDGQHRWLALVELGQEKALCEVLHDLPVEHQARVFSVRNQGRVAVGHLDAFRADFVAGDQETAAIVGLLGQHGYHVAYESRRPSASGVVCVVTLRDIYRWGVLDETLRLIKLAWSSDPMATQVALLQGVAAVVRLYDSPYPSAIPGGLLVKAAVRCWIKRTATDVLARARMRQVAVGDHRGWASVAAVLVDLYNHGRRAEHRLPAPEIPSTAARDWKESRSSGQLEVTI